MKMKKNSKKIIFFSTLTFFCSILLSSYGKETKEITHKFLLNDEARAQLHYVNEKNSKKDWTLKLPAKYRDMQLIGDNKLLMSTLNGYRVIDLKSQKTIKEVKGNFYGTESVRRLTNGQTIIAAKQKNGLNFYRLDKNDKIIEKANFPKFYNIRLIRILKDGKISFGCNGNHFVITDFSGKIYHDLKIPNTSYIYQILQLPNGNFLIATGFRTTIAEMDQTGKIIKEWGGKNHPFAKKHNFHFFAGMQVLKNGNIVVTNWSGHGKNDSSKGTQVIEFNNKNEIVWSWKNPAKTGSPYMIIVTDNLDLNKLNNEVNVTLETAPMQK